MNTKKLISILVIIVVAVGVFSLFLLKNNKANIAVPVVENKSDIEVFMPKPSDAISSPFKITGVVRGSGWSGFEGQVGTVKLLDSDGKELATGILKATTEWTTLPTNFETNLTFTAVSGTSGTLVFKNENPSGMRQRDKIFNLQVTFK